MTTRRPLLTAEEIWRRYDGAEQRLTAPVSERMLDLAELRPGMRVLDLATGRGEPAVRAAHRVGPTGAILGVDLSAARRAMVPPAVRVGVDCEISAGAPSYFTDR